MKHDYTFEQALPKGRYIQATLRTFDLDKPSSVTLAVWEDKNRNILRYDVALELEDAWQKINQAWNAGLKVLPGTEQDFFVLQHYYHLTDEMREAMLYNLRQYTGEEPVLT